MTGKVLAAALLTVVVAASSAGGGSSAAAAGPVAAMDDDAFSASFRCPESLPTVEQKQQALRDYFDWVGARHGDWTVKQVLDYRYRLLTSHRCAETLQHIHDNGK